MLIVTLDLDWAPEPAIEETLNFIRSKGISPTVFATHTSPSVLNCMNEIEVGLHPFFDPSSSHGSTYERVVDTVLSIPHNIPAYRCHRFASCNKSRQLMKDAGMQISSNVCTDLEVIAPFRDRIGLTEVPIFFEDGSYLLNRHPLDITQTQAKLSQDPLDWHVILIHPMHFAINTPTFGYMEKIKQSHSRSQWNTMSSKELNSLRWKGTGIRDTIEQLFYSFTSSGPLAQSITNSSKTLYF
jgi:hypothetical protein